VANYPWLVQDGIAVLQRDNVKMTAREVMQIFGSNVCRRMSPNCWANATLQKIIKEQPDYAFITDARFPNELDIFLPYNPIVIRLSRNLFNSQHVSEVALDKYPWQNIQRFIPIDNADMDLDNKNSLVYTEFLKYKG
jgi:hypothetical protein